MQQTVVEQKTLVFSADTWSSATFRRRRGVPRVPEIEQQNGAFRRILVSLIIDRMQQTVVEQKTLVFSADTSSSATFRRRRGVPAVALADRDDNANGCWLPHSAARCVFGVSRRKTRTKRTAIHQIRQLADDSCSFRTTLQVLLYPFPRFMKLNTRHSPLLREAQFSCHPSGCTSHFLEVFVLCQHQMRQATANSSGCVQVHIYLQPSSN